MTLARKQTSNKTSRRGLLESLRIVLMKEPSASLIPLERSRNVPQECDSCVRSRAASPADMRSSLIVTFTTGFKAGSASLGSTERVRWLYSKRAAAPLPGSSSDPRLPHEVLQYPGRRNLNQSRIHGMALLIQRPAIDWTRLPAERDAYRHSLVGTWHVSKLVGP